MVSQWIWSRSEEKKGQNGDRNLVELTTTLGRTTEARYTVVNQSRVDGTHKTNHTPFLVQWKSVNLPSAVRELSPLE